MSDNIRFLGSTTAPVSRRRFLQGALTLTGGTTIMTSISCGGSDAPSVVTPSLSPTPTPTAIALAQNYNFAYSIPETENVGRIIVTQDGEVFTAQSVVNEAAPTTAVITRFTNGGKPGATDRFTVREALRIAPYEATYFGLSPDKEIYVPYCMIDSTLPFGTIAVLSVTGEVIRTFRIESSQRIGLGSITFGASGTMYVTRDNTVRRYNLDGSLKNIVLNATKDDDGQINSLSSPAILPGDVVWSATYDSFNVANADGSSKRTVPFGDPYRRSPSKVTRSDAEGNLYVSRDLPFRYPDDVYGDPATINDTFVVKYTQDGTFLAAMNASQINTSRTSGSLQDFDVDQVGNVYVASGNGVSVYQRVR